MFNKIILSLSIIALIFINNTGQLSAHEFWIEPDAPSGDMQLKMFAHVRVGQNFKGPEQYYIPDDIQKIKIYNPDSSYELKKTIGDYPIFNEPAKSPGLQILSYQSTPYKLTYVTFEKFEKFIRNVGLDPVLEEHKKRGLPMAGFTELYIRYGKALLTRGNTSGQDKKLGFKIELIAQINPYEFDQSKSNGMMPIKLVWNDQPLKNAQIAVFQKTENGALKSKIFTNGDGVAELPVSIGQTYMLNSVQMTEEIPKSGAVWKSHWASLTFTITAKQ